MPTLQTPPSLLLLHMELRHTDPLVWRAVLVPDTVTLVQLHQVIQTAMGWHDCHLHEFIIGGTHYGVPSPGWDLGPPLINESRKRLLKVLGPRRQFDYVYDFGDHWLHRITLERRLPPTGPRTRVQCVGGANACPPEDVGGVPGYYDFLDALADPRREDHAGMREWIGGSFDPAFFNMAATDAALGRIKV